MEWLASDLLQLFERFLFPFLRLSGLFLIAPFFSSHSIPHRIRLLFALLLAFPLSAQIAPFTPMALFSFQSAIVIFTQLMIGFAIGFVLSLVMQIFVIVGQLVAMQMGLSFSSMVDPQSGISVPLISQLYLFLATLIFLTVNGHLTVLQALADSFKTIPILPEKQWVMGAISQLLAWGKSIFETGLLIALPLVVALLLVNIALAVISRAAPQLNIFSVGFPLTLTVGIWLVWLTMGSMDAHMVTSIQDGFEVIKNLLIV